MQKSILYLVSFSIVFSSCVTPKIHNALIAENELTKSNLINQQKKNLNLQLAVEGLEVKVKALKINIADLRNDSMQNGSALIIIQEKYDALSESYDLLASKNSREMANKAKETKKLLEQLEQSQSELFFKEDELSKKIIQKKELN